MANKIKQLIAQRDTDIYRLTDLRNIADQALVDRNIRSNFKLRYQHLNSIYEDFETQHKSLVAALSVEKDYDSATQYKIRSDFDNDYYHIQTVYSQLFDSELTLNQTSDNSVTRSSNIKLPKIEIQKFDGDLKTWQTFHDMFLSMIHENDTLSNIEKFNYLINSLRGPPLALVKCTPMTSDNYIIAYNALIKRYQNRRPVATAHWREIENCKKLTSSDNSHSLRNLVDTFVENIAALENLKFPTKHWDFILVHMLLDRLDTPTATRFELEDVGDEVPTFKSLTLFLNKQCDALDTVSSSTRHRRKGNMMGQLLMFGMMAAGLIVIPMGFQFLAVLGGKALLLAKLALLLTSIQGLKKIATSHMNYGLYSTGHGYTQGPWHFDRQWPYELDEHSTYGYTVEQPHADLLHPVHSSLHPRQDLLEQTY